jgi:hypothetical protein
VPELPDVTVYLDALERRVLGHRLVGVRLASPFVLRSIDLPLAAVAGATVRGLGRLGKRAGGLARRRDELLPALPDGRQAAGRSLAVTAPARRLAGHLGGPRRTATAPAVTLWHRERSIA